MATRIIVPSFLHEHFGDIICIISEIERLHNEGYEVLIGDRDVEEVNNRYLSYLSIYNLNWTYKVSGNFVSTYSYRDFSELYKNLPLIPKISHIPKLYKKITYTKDANWKIDEKLNPEWDKLWGTFPGVEWIEVNRNVGDATKCQQLIAESDLFIGVDNGVSHLAKSIGTPMILLEHTWELERGFPSNIFSYTKAKTNDEVISIITSFYENYKTI